MSAPQTPFGEATGSKSRQQSLRSAYRKGYKTPRIANWRLMAALGWSLASMFLTVPLCAGVLATFLVANTDYAFTDLYQSPAKIIVFGSVYLGVVVLCIIMGFDIAQAYNNYRKAASVKNDPYHKKADALHGARSTRNMHLFVVSLPSGLGLSLLAIILVAFF